MIRVKTILLFILLGFSLIFLTPFGLILFPLTFTGLRKTADYCLSKIAQGWAWTLIVCTGCRLKVMGQENVPRQGGFCLVSNHCSIFDIVLLLATIGRPIGFIAKKELSYIPFLNLWIPFIGGSFIDRSNVRKALKTINRGIAYIKSGGAMIVFPEGTRSKGRGLLPFHAGSLKLATKSGAPIVPMAITGSYDVFEKTGLVHSADVTVTIAPPIDITGISTPDQRTDLLNEVYNVIAEAIKAAEGQAQAAIRM
jgi:1-acyl-sn-glycerol-3-phosphate acyltransferase